MEKEGDDMQEKRKGKFTNDEDFFELERSPSKFRSSWGSISPRRSPESIKDSSRDSSLLNKEIRMMIRPKSGTKKVSKISQLLIIWWQIFV